jgi:hypothetical protein
VVGEKPEFSCERKSVPCSLRNGGKLRLRDYCLLRLPNVNAEVLLGPSFIPEERATRRYGAYGEQLTVHGKERANLAHSYVYIWTMNYRQLLEAWSQKHAQ